MARLAATLIALAAVLEPSASFDDTFSLVTVRQNDSRPLQAGVTAPSVSGDGRYVAFVSFARLVEGDTDDRLDVYVLDRVSGRVTLETPSNGPGASYESDRPRLDADGRLLVFESRQQGEADDPSAGWTIVVRDRETGATRQIGPPGGQSNGSSREPTNQRRRPSGGIHVERDESGRRWRRKRIRRGRVCLRRQHESCITGQCGGLRTTARGRVECLPDGERQRAVCGIYLLVGARLAGWTRIRQADCQRVRPGPHQGNDDPGEHRGQRRGSERPELRRRESARPADTWPSSPKRAISSRGIATATRTCSCATSRRRRRPSSPKVSTAARQTGPAPNRRFRPTGRSWSFNRTRPTSCVPPDRGGHQGHQPGRGRVRLAPRRSHD